MKKTVQTLLTLLLVVALASGIGTVAFADGEADVTIGFDGAYLPVRVAVNAEDGAEATINGISYCVRVQEGYMFVRQRDVAMAELVSNNLELLKELGLDLSQLYIKQGMLLVKEDGLSEEEIDAIYTKISEFEDKAEKGFLNGTQVEFTCGGEAITADVIVVMPEGLGTEDNSNKTADAPASPPLDADSA